ncbi:DNA GYRASE B3 [Striga hermonthica]|uniref:DNA GYRASE B3 n=1 Tax=Striga hermonthica TaxID=68872 RepID=A0A9N7RAD0_STRHE|nr:DNA GYRASE B3 [Striga hermonthica]
MKLSEKPKTETFESTKPTDRLAFITNPCVKLAIPIGPRFQVHVPSWSPPFTSTKNGPKPVDSRWLGAQIWPTKGKMQEDTKHDNTIGKGRPDTCECAIPLSIECVRRHVSDKRTRLRVELGPAFWQWKFDSMGEDVSRMWSREDESAFSNVVRMKPSSHGGGFVKWALECFPSHNKGSILSYYLNVYIPRRIRIQTGSGCVAIDTDEEEVEEEEEEIVPIKRSRKRLRANSLVSGSSMKYIKKKYLSRCR